MLKLITESSCEPEVNVTLDELARLGAQRMIKEALLVEVEEYVSRLSDVRDDRGHAQVVRNGYGKARRITVGSGTLEIRAPRVHDRREGSKFTSAILPPYVRRSPNVESVLPVLYLRGLSTGDFAPALRDLLGEEASGLSSSSINRLTEQFHEEYQSLRRRDFSQEDYVYIWADGVHFNLRLEKDRLSALVIVGVRLDGQKEVLALEDAHGESKESWLTVLLDLKARGLRAPLLAVADGALGFWNALAEVYPETDRQQCWVHKVANVLDKLPKRLRARAKAQLHEIMNAPTEKAAEEEKQRFEREFGAKYPKALDSLTRDWEYLVTLYGYPAEHWIHLRTTNPIESTFSTVKLRTRTTRGAGSRKAGLAMAFKLMMMAQESWRAINAPHLIALLKQGITFKDGERQKTEKAKLTQAKDAA